MGVQIITTTYGSIRNKILDGNMYVEFDAYGVEIGSGDAWLQTGTRRDVHTLSILRQDGLLPVEVAVSIGGVFDKCEVSNLGELLEEVKRLYLGVGECVGIREGQVNGVGYTQYIYIIGKTGEASLRHVWERIKQAMK